MPEAEDLKPFRPGWGLKTVFLTIGILNLAAALDATSLSVALPMISSDLHGTAIEAFWSGTSFLVTSTVFQPILSSFSDIFGRKFAILLAIVLFALGAILAGCAHGFTLMLVGRSIQGVGAGGIIALTEVILTDLIPLRERGKWFGIISVTWAIGSVSGPVVGGAFVEDVTWRWIFWINLPIAGLGLLLVPVLLKLHFQRTSMKSKLAKIDYIGCFLFICSLTSFLIPLTWGGVMYDWDSWRTLVPLILGVAGLMAFAGYEKWLARKGGQPLIPLYIFANPSSSINYLGAFLHGLVLWSALYYLPLYYEGVQGYSPVISGIAMFPETFTVGPASLFVGIIVAVTGKYRWALWFGWVLTTAGMGLLYLLDVDASIVKWIFLNIVPGLGTGHLFPALALAIQASAPSNNMAIAVTMTTFFRNLGQAVGVAIGGVVFQNRIKSQLQSHPDLSKVAAQYAQDASGLVEVIKQLPPDGRTHTVKVAYANSLADLWVVMCGLAGLGLITSIFIKEYNLNQALESNQGYRGSSESGDKRREVPDEIIRAP